MNATASAHPPISEARVGGWIEVAGSPAGARSRRGGVLEILGHPGHTHFRVRRDESREVIVYPEHEGAIVHRAAGHRR